MNTHKLHNKYELKVKSSAKFWIEIVHVRTNSAHMPTLPTARMQQTQDLLSCRRSSFASTNNGYRCVFCTFATSLFAHRFSKPQNTAEATNKYPSPRIRTMNIFSALDQKKKGSGIRKTNVARRSVVYLVVLLLANKQ